MSVIYSKRRAAVPVEEPERAPKKGGKKTASKKPTQDKSTKET